MAALVAQWKLIQAGGTLAATELVNTIDPLVDDIWSKLLCNIDVTNYIHLKILSTFASSMEVAGSPRTISALLYKMSKWPPVSSKTTFFNFFKSSTLVISQGMEITPYSATRRSCKCKTDCGEAPKTL